VPHTSTHAFACRRCDLPHAGRRAPAGVVEPVPQGGRDSRDAGRMLAARLYEDVDDIRDADERRIDLSRASAWWRLVRHGVARRRTGAPGFLTRLHTGQ
jgi:hypothetical protein